MFLLISMILLLLGISYLVMDSKQKKELIKNFKSVRYSRIGEKVFKLKNRKSRQKIKEEIKRGDYE